MVCLESRDKNSRTCACKSPGALLACFLSGSGSSKDHQLTCLKGFSPDLLKEDVQQRGIKTVRAHVCVCVCVRVVVENYDTVWQESFQSHVEPFQDLSSVSSWEAVFSPSHFAILIELLSLRVIWRA